MKRFMKAAWILAASALAFSSCVEEQALAPQDEQAGKITVNITAGSADTKTHLDGTNQVKWDSANEKIELLEMAGTSFSHVTSAAGTTTDNGETAKFTAALTSATGSSFDYYAVYPSTNYFVPSKDDNDLVAKIKLLHPAEQHPTADSYDPAADLLVAQGVHMNAQATDLNFQFARPIAVMEMTVKGLTDGENIQSVEFKSNTAILSGRMYYDFENGKVLEYGYDKPEVRAINCIYDKAYPAKAAGNKVFFTVFPTGNKEGNALADFTVTVNTDKATYSKTVTPPTALTINPNDYVRFSVAGLERNAKVFGEYLLLTDASDLEAGDKIIITNGTDGTIKAMGDKQASKNRMDQVTVTAANSKIASVPAEVNVITLEGAKDNFLLKGMGGYISLNKTENELLYKLTAADASKWMISIPSGKSNTDITSTTGLKEGTTPRPIRFNQSFFASYKGTTSCAPVYVFYMKGKDALSQPTNVNAVPSANTIKVTWDAVAGAAGYTVLCGDKSVEVTDGSNTHTFDNLLWQTTYAITVVAHPSDTAKYRDSESDAKEVTTEANASATLLDTPTGLTATVTGNKVALTWAAVTDAKNYTVTCGEQEINVSTPSAELSDLLWGTTVQISVVANPDPSNAALAKSEAAVVSATIPAEPAKKNYTLTIDKKTLDILNNNTDKMYEKYNGNHTMEAVCDDDASVLIDVLINTKDVAYNGKIQMKGGSGIIKNVTDLGTVNSVTVNTPSGKTISTSKAAGNFTIKAGSGASYCKSLVIKFTK